MRVYSAKKAYALILALALLCAIVLSSCLLALGSGHSCACCDCLVCQAIRAAFRKLGKVCGAVSGGWGSLAAAAFLPALFGAVSGVFVRDLVRLKVKLSD